VVLGVTTILCLALQGEFPAPLLVRDRRSFERTAKIVGRHGLASSTFSSTELAALPFLTIVCTEKEGTVYKEQVMQTISWDFRTRIMGRRRFKRNTDENLQLCCNWSKTLPGDVLN
jgi:hypothetical protein